MITYLNEPPLVMTDAPDLTTAVTMARTWLTTERNLDETTADNLLVDPRAAWAWWGGDQIGFVSETYPDAQQVAVAHFAEPVPEG